MQFFTITVVLAALGTAVSSVNGYMLGNSTNLKWTGPNSKGENVTLYGMAHEVAAQLKVIDPKWIPRIKPSHPVLSARDPSVNNTLCCPVAGQTFTPQNVTDVQDALNQLYAIAGEFEFMPDSNECYTAAVSNGAAIVSCNTISGFGSIIGVKDVADYGSFVVKTCSQNNSPVCGQTFNGPYNMIVDKYSGLADPVYQTQ